MSDVLNNFIKRLLTAKSNDLISRCLSGHVKCQTDLKTCLRALLCLQRYALYRLLPHSETVSSRPRTRPDFYINFCGFVIINYLVNIATDTAVCDCGTSLVRCS